MGSAILPPHLSPHEHFPGKTWASYITYRQFFLSWDNSIHVSLMGITHMYIIYYCSSTGWTSMLDTTVKCTWPFYSTAWSTRSCTLTILCPCTRRRSGGSQPWRWVKWYNLWLWMCKLYPSFSPIASNIRAILLLPMVGTFFHSFSSSLTSLFRRTSLGRELDLEQRRDPSMSKNDSLLCFSDRSCLFISSSVAIELAVLSVYSVYIDYTWLS